MTQTFYLFIFAVIVAAGIGIYYYRRGQEKEITPDSGNYIEGLKSLLRGQEEEAFAKLKETVRSDTGNIDAYIHLGNIFRKMNKPEQALKVHRDLTHRGNLTNIEKREILIGLYHDYMVKGDEETAIKAIKELLAQVSNDRFALRILLKHLEKNGEWKDAAQVRCSLDKLDNIESKRNLALYKTFEGNDLYNNGDPHRARLFYKEAIHIDKNCLAAYIAIGDSYYSEQRQEDALDYWNRVIALKPNEGHIVFERLKKAFFEIGRYGEYADTLSNLLQSFPEHLTARLELAYFLEKKGDIDLAREHFITAQDNYPESLMAKLGLLRLNRKTNRQEAVDKTFKQIMKIAVKIEAGSFHCSECGLISEKKLWICTRCKAVDTF